VEMAAITPTGDTANLVLDFSIRRIFPLERRIHGSFIIGDEKYISAWDVDFFVRTGRNAPENERSATGFDVFFPHYLEINNANDLFSALQNQARIFTSDLRFSEVMIIIFPESYAESIVYFAPARSIEDIDHIMNLIGWS